MPALALEELRAAKRLITLLDVAYDVGSRVTFDPASCCAIDRVLAAFLQARKDGSELFGPSVSQVDMRGSGGSSSSLSMTLVDGGVEWSGTGRDASLGDGGSGDLDVLFAAQRAYSRLVSMARGG